jgi:hypothetical protein
MHTYDLRSQRRIFWNYKGFTLIEQTVNRRIRNGYVAAALRIR